MNYGTLNLNLKVPFVAGNSSNPIIIRKNVDVSRWMNKEKKMKVVGLLNFMAKEVGLIMSLKES